MVYICTVVSSAAVTFSIHMFRRHLLQPAVFTRVHRPCGVLVNKASRAAVFTIRSIGRRKVGFEEHRCGIFGHLHRSVEDT